MRRREQSRDGEEANPVACDRGMSLGCSRSPKRLNGCESKQVRLRVEGHSGEKEWLGLGRSPRTWDTVPGKVFDFKPTGDKALEDFGWWMDKWGVHFAKAHLAAV